MAADWNRPKVRWNRIKTSDNGISNQPALEKTMRKLTFGVFALAFASTISPAAHATSILFDFSNPSGIATDLNLTLGSQVSPGVYNITSVTGTFADANFGLGTTPVTGIVPDGAGLPTILSTITGSGPGYTSPDGQEVYDNLAYTNAPLVFDNWGGVLFLVNSGLTTYQVDIAGEGNSYQAWVNVEGAGDFTDYGTVLTNGSVTVTPEPGTLFLFGTGLMFLAAFLVFRSKKPTPASPLD
jgi:hypothetical protein